MRQVPGFYHLDLKAALLDQRRNEALVLKAREMGLAGATMLRGLMGYGAASRIHTAKILRLSEDLPVIAEIVDSPEKISSFLSVVDEMIREGLVTAENFYATIAEFFPVAKDFCSLNISTFIASSACNSGPTLT